MRKLNRWRRLFRSLLPAVLLSAYWTSWPAAPVPVAAAPSQDPDEEIVYIDGDGVIRVLDTRVTGGNPEIKWFSPDNGWRDFTLGDVNNDGDLEIIAIGGGSSNGKLAVFDPVVSSGVINPEQKINEVPWDTLYRTDVPGSPQLVAAGEFDINLPGDEIIYLYELRDEDKENRDDRLRLIALKADSPTPTGRGWQEHFRLNFSEEWKDIAVGNLDGRDTDEFALVSEESANMQVWRVDGGAKRIYEYGSTSRAPKAVAIGHWRAGSKAYLGWTRGAEPPLAAFLVQEWDRDDEFDDVADEAFDPSPRIIFFAQINDNDDEEVVLLRTVPGNVNSPRMIVRGRNDDDIPSELELRLDSDNGYRAGAAGDVDGDGFDEIVLIRDNRILVFYEADRSDRTNSYDLSTNRSSVEVGDLDSAGFISGPQFGTDRSQIDAVVEAGGTPKSDLLTLTNTASTEPVPFSINVVGNPSWLTVQPLAGMTPAQIFLQFNSFNIQAGDYRTQLQIFSSNPDVQNQPYVVEVTLKVTAALVSLQPSSLSISYPCTDTATIPARTIRVDGTSGIRYSAAIIPPPIVAAAQASLAGPIYNGYVDDAGQLIVRDDQGNEAVVPTAGDLVSASGVNSTWPSGVSWLSARSERDSIPDRITLQATSLYSETIRYDEALLVIVADSRAGAPPGNVRIVTVANLCATDFLRMPLITR
jgi:hypothetical protein